MSLLSYILSISIIYRPEARGFQTVVCDTHFGDDIKDYSIQQGIVCNFDQMSIEVIWCFEMYNLKTCFMF